MKKTKQNSFINSWWNAIYKPSFDLFTLYFFVHSYIFRHKSHLSPSKNDFEGRCVFHLSCPLLKIFWRKHIFPSSFYYNISDIYETFSEQYPIIRNFIVIIRRQMGDKIKSLRANTYHKIMIPFPYRVINVRSIFFFRSKNKK